ncbi:HNH endonuclease signature motif containing protein [Galbibacter sp.]|uniref:HNH endonuclease signature motif containing protein n=1 Tax=Galbibacter sp. TaxID=2918471 RepID=UPI003A90D995
MNNLQLLLFIVGLFLTNPIFSQDNYRVGNTEYYYNKTYSTTGKPMVKRSETNKREFLRRKGYSSTPYGYEIDHIKPLSEGGTDDPSNMQLLTKRQHARKTARERMGRSNSTYNAYPVFKSNSTYKGSSNSYYSTPSSSSISRGKTIYMGSRGGRYYINSKGNKTYIKSGNSSRTYNHSIPSNNSNGRRAIRTGSRGGKYYINSNGNKTYVK